MRELSQLRPLRQDDPLRSPSGRYVLRYDAEGVAVVMDTATGESTWRAGEPGEPAAGVLLLGAGCAVQVQIPEGVWTSAIAAKGARELILTDAGDLELLDGEGALIFNARTGPVEPQALGDRAPAADITASRFLLYETDRKRRTVVRQQDGTLRIGEHEDGGGGHYSLSDQLARWFDEQDGTVLTWRLLPDGRTQDSKSWTLCLTSRDDRVLWREPMGNPTTVPPRPTAHAHGGPELSADEQAAEDFTSWMDALNGGTEYCATVIHDISPDEALRRLGADPEQIMTGTFGDLLTQSEVEDVEFEDLAVAAFALGPHTLLVEDRGWAGVDSPQLSEGTFAVSSCKSFNAASYFAVYRDGKQVADHSEDREKEPSTPEVRAALDAMGADDASHTAFRRGLELLCRTAGVRPTVADVTGVARWVIILDS